jgi:hypothetical protein
MVMQLLEKRLKPTEIALCLSCYRLAIQRRSRCHHRYDFLDLGDHDGPASAWH